MPKSAFCGSWNTKFSDKKVRNWWQFERLKRCRITGRIGNLRVRCGFRYISLQLSSNLPGEADVDGRNLGKQEGKNDNQCIIMLVMQISVFTDLVAVTSSGWGSQLMVVLGQSGCELGQQGGQYVYYCEGVLWF
ncbi:hypothetical protein SS50377_21660 [Spironucleus salmonicida]|uniref:Uncharacterized protein n=1 Tax=Spironucleus salmonicida TaxID=348837 RepID=V6LD37_9EUKA|nr:hypothetical protein SS50377_21660 [Spironucleus salmonicida]|eukprot:EST42377.1 Hypothetical protein SS50377_18063 [Spironucleus salmonicida]